MSGSCQIDEISSKMGDGDGKVVTESVQRGVVNHGGESQSRKSGMVDKGRIGRGDVGNADSGDNIHRNDTSQLKLGSDEPLNDKNDKNDKVLKNNLGQNGSSLGEINNKNCTTHIDPNDSNSYPMYQIMDSFSTNFDSQINSLNPPSQTLSLPTVHSFMPFNDSQLSNGKIDTQKDEKGGKDKNDNKTEAKAPNHSSNDQPLLLNQVQPNTTPVQSHDNKCDSTELQPARLLFDQNSPSNHSQNYHQNNPHNYNFLYESLLPDLEPMSQLSPQKSVQSPPIITSTPITTTILPSKHASPHTPKPQPPPSISTPLDSITPLTKRNLLLVPVSTAKKSLYQRKTPTRLQVVEPAYDEDATLLPMDSDNDGDDDGDTNHSKGILYAKFNSKMEKNTTITPIKKVEKIENLMPKIENLPNSANITPLPHLFTQSDDDLFDSDHNNEDLLVSQVPLETNDSKKHPKTHPKSKQTDPNDSFLSITSSNTQNLSQRNPFLNGIGSGDSFPTSNPFMNEDFQDNTANTQYAMTQDKSTNRFQPNLIKTLKGAQFRYNLDSSDDDLTTFLSRPAKLDPKIDSNCLRRPVLTDQANTATDDLDGFFCDGDDNDENLFSPPRSDHVGSNQTNTGLLSKNMFDLHDDFDEDMSLSTKKASGGAKGSKKGKSTTKIKGDSQHPSGNIGDQHDSEIAKVEENNNVDKKKVSKTRAKKESMVETNNDNGSQSITDNGSLPDPVSTPVKRRTQRKKATDNDDTKDTEAHNDGFRSTPKPTNTRSTKKTKDDPQVGEDDDDSFKKGKDKTTRSVNKKSLQSDLSKTSSSSSSLSSSLLDTTKPSILTLIQQNCKETPAQSQSLFDQLDTPSTTKPVLKVPINLDDDSDIEIIQETKPFVPDLLFSPPPVPNPNKKTKIDPLTHHNTLLRGGSYMVKNHDGENKGKEFAKSLESMRFLPSMASIGNITNSSDLERSRQEQLRLERNQLHMDMENNLDSNDFFLKALKLSGKNTAISSGGLSKTGVANLGAKLNVGDGGGSGNRSGLDQDGQGPASLKNSLYRKGKANSTMVEDGVENSGENSGEKNNNEASSRVAKRFNIKIPSRHSLDNLGTDDDTLSSKQFEEVINFSKELSKNGNINSQAKKIDKSQTPMSDDTDDGESWFDEPVKVPTLNKTLQPITKPLLVKSPKKSQNNDQSKTIHSDSNTNLSQEILLNDDIHNQDEDSDDWFSSNTKPNPKPPKMPAKISPQKLNQHPKSNFHHFSTPANYPIENDSDASLLASYDDELDGDYAQIKRKRLSLEGDVHTEQHLHNLPQKNLDNNPVSNYSKNSHNSSSKTLPQPSHNITPQLNPLVQLSSKPPPPSRIQSLLLSGIDKTKSSNNSIFDELDLEAVQNAPEKRDNRVIKPIKRGRTSWLNVGKTDDGEGSNYGDVKSSTPTTSDNQLSVPSTSWLSGSKTNTSNSVGNNNVTIKRSGILDKYSGSSDINDLFNEVGVIDGFGGTGGKGKRKRGMEDLAQQYTIPQYIPQNDPVLEAHKAGQDEFLKKMRELEGDGGVDGINMDKKSGSKNDEKRNKVEAGRVKGLNQGRVVRNNSQLSTHSKLAPLLHPNPEPIQQEPIFSSVPPPGHVKTPLSHGNTNSSIQRTSSKQIPPQNVILITKSAKYHDSDSLTESDNDYLDNSDSFSDNSDSDNSDSDIDLNYPTSRVTKNPPKPLSFRLPKKTTKTTKTTKKNQNSGSTNAMDMSPDDFVRDNPGVTGKYRSDGRRRVFYLTTGDQLVGPKSYEFYTYFKENDLIDNNSRRKRGTGTTKTSTKSKRKSTPPKATKATRTKSTTKDSSKESQDGGISSLLSSSLSQSSSLNSIRSGTVSRNSSLKRTVSKTKTKTTSNVPSVRNEIEREQKIKDSLTTLRGTGIDISIPAMPKIDPMFAPARK